MCDTGERGCADDVAPVAKPDFDSVDLSFMSQGSGQDDWAASQDTASLQAQSRREAQELVRPRCMCAVAAALV